MGSINTPTLTKQGWVIDIPEEVLRTLNVPAGSVALLYAHDGNLSVDILPPPSPELIDEVNETWDELHGAFEEMKRRGD